MENNLSIICTGSTGLVASHFKKYCQDQAINFYGIDLHGEGESIDITNYHQLFNYVKKIKDLSRSNQDKTSKASLPDSSLILFHFAAITLTGTNLTSSQIDLTNRVNIDGTKNILKVCKQLSLPLVHISTDFVFSGASKATPYLPSDKTQTDNTIYSQSKKTAEDLVLSSSQSQLISIIRIAFPYGNFSHDKKGLARKMIDWMDNSQQVKLYTNQRICPTPISYISTACFKVAHLISDQKLNSGQIFHVVGQPTTPFEFGSTIKKVFGKKAELLPNLAQDTYTNLVLDTSQTESLLNIKTNHHQSELEALKPFI